ncbi:hypothetical protein EB052_01105 [bacterium]|nr:hypothetical protein [bacterium]
MHVSSESLQTCKDPLSEIIHDELDEWHFASTTDVYSLAGWGRPTTEALQYEEREGCLIGGCIKHILMTPRNSLLGDGTVLSQSAAAYSAGHTLFVNLDAKHEDAVHSNILGSASVLNALSTIISMSSSTDILANLYSIPNISDHIPQEYTQMRSLRIGVHSPVDIHVYDAKGNHTGRARNPIPDSDLDFVEEKIPGGSYSIIGEDKYVSIEGVTPGDVYTVNVRGTGEGTFDLDIDESLGDMIVATSSFRSVPVTVGMSATTSVRVGGISRGKLSVGDLLRVDEQGVNLMRSENTVMVEDSKKEMASRRSRSRASSTLLISEPSPAMMDVDMNDHVNRIVDLMKKNKRFLSSLSVGDRAFLLDILQML